MVSLSDIAYLKPVQRAGRTILYGAIDADGPWWRLTKRETAWIVANVDALLPDHPDLDRPIPPEDIN